MSSSKSQSRNVLASRVSKQGVVAMVSCTRCARSQKECRLSSLSRKCAECIRTGKKCEPAEPVVNFAGIDRALEKLEREELEAETLQVAAIEQLRLSQAKLQRLRKQKRFLKEREQRMFDKGLDDVEELERLEDRERAAEVERAAAASLSLDDFLCSGALSPDATAWLAQGSAFDETAVSFLGSSSNA